MDDAIAAVRNFNRFFTKLVGALDQRFLGSDMSLPEARLLFEIAHGNRPVAADLRAALDIDAGHVSRVLRRFEARGWVARGRVSGDARRRPIALTAAGRAAFETLDRRQRTAVAALLERLGPAQRAMLTGALRFIEALLDTSAGRRFELRPPAPGDVSHVAARQSVLYRTVYGWGPQIEAIIADMAAAFLRDAARGRARCWIAEVGGTIAGSVFLTDEGGGLARLRLLYVEPFARGLGIGDALVGACVRFATEAGYARMTLWTHAVLTSARRIYAGHGFALVESHEHDDFGVRVLSETWDRDLAAA